MDQILNFALKNPVVSPLPNNPNTSMPDHFEERMSKSR